jgi:DDE superfamily endonuclease
LKQYWAIPPEHSAEFVAAMEEVLAVYQRPLDPVHPVICMDETSKQLVGETRLSLPVAPGQPQREDYEYERHGVANLFLFSEPLTGGREVRGTERRTRADWAEAMRELSDRCYPAAERITVVLDNLNTHGPASFYEVFAPAEALNRAVRLPLHTQTRLLAQQGRDRIQCVEPAVLEPAHKRCRDFTQRDPGLAAETQ